MRHSILMMAAWLSVATAAGADFFVATDGSDDHPGTEAQPFATLQRARLPSMTTSLETGPIARLSFGEYSAASSRSRAETVSLTSIARSAAPPTRPATYGSTRESVNRQLRAWSAEGLVEIVGGALALRDPEALRAMAE